jgi:hypothetical protein
MRRYSLSEPIMATVITYTSNFDPEPLISCLPGGERISVGSRHDLATRIVEERLVCAVVVQVERLDDEMRLFLTALQKSFPLLEVIAVTSLPAVDVPQGIIRFDPDDTGDQSAHLRRRCEAIERENRLKLRFDWPLQGDLSADGIEWVRLGVRSLSASGAFLQHEGSLERFGKIANLKIEFQDTTLRTRCEILDYRLSSSNLPPGFGVRFTGISESAARAIDAIVKNALIAALLQPEAEPGIPSLDVDDSLTL